MPVNTAVEIRGAKLNDREEIVDCLRKCFFIKNPLQMHMKLITKEQPISEEYEKYILKALDHPEFSLVAVKDDKIIGVCLNKEENRQNYLAPKLTKIQDEKFKIYAQFWLDVNTRVDVFNMYPELDKIFSVQTICVRSEYRGMGIALELCSKSRDLAKSMGYKMITCGCANYYSAKIFQKLGFDVIWKLPYDEYLVDGEIIYKQELPHTALQYLAQKI